MAAFIVEPVIGEGGYIVPPPGFLPRLREIADQHGILLIADEVQTGFGRTGRFFAVEHWGVVPDILVMAKGIASGLPLSGILAPAATLARWAPGAHGGTYGGNVVACAAANATLDVIERRGAGGERRGARPRSCSTGSGRSASAHPSVGDVRGLGCMVALEFVRPDADRPARARSGAMAKRVLAEALSRHLMLLSAGSWGQVVRIIPPLVTTADEVDQASRSSASRSQPPRAPLSPWRDSGSSPAATNGPPSTSVASTCASAGRAGVGREEVAIEHDQVGQPSRPRPRRSRVSMRLT